MKQHAFVGKVTTDVVVEDGHIVSTPGQAVVAQVKGSRKGTLAQVCEVCEETADENGRTPDHKED